MHLQNGRGYGKADTGGIVWGCLLQSLASFEPNRKNIYFLSSKLHSYTRSLSCVVTALGGGNPLVHRSHLQIDNIESKREAVYYAHANSKPILLMNKFLVLCSRNLGNDKL